jgi:hypothetical protein
MTLEHNMNKGARYDMWPCGLCGDAPATAALLGQFPSLDLGLLLSASGLFLLSCDFCLPTRATIVPRSPDWIHEVKYDGYRLRVERDGDRVRLITRVYPATPANVRCW